MYFNSLYKPVEKIFSHLSLLQCLAICLFFTTSATVRAEFYVIPVVGNNTSIPITDVKNMSTTQINTNSTENVIEVTPGAASNGIFTVPNDKYLVITAISVFPVNPGSGTVQVQLLQNTLARKYWVLPNSEPTQLSFGHGLLIAPGFALKIKNFTSSAGPIRVGVYGYLTKA